MCARSRRHLAHDRRHRGRPLDDARQGFENFIGNEFGVRALRRDEKTTSQPRPLPAARMGIAGAGCFTAGLRHSRVSFDVDDRYLSNGNDSGSVDYSHTTPLLGVLYKLTPR
jgi:iron complex outermembrane receptor protein